jgi:hypothetical protein
MFFHELTIAPAAAGLLVYWLGYNSCFYLDSASFFFSAAMLSSGTGRRCKSRM